MGKNDWQKLLESARLAFENSFLIGEFERTKILSLLDKIDSEQTSFPIILQEFKEVVRDFVCEFFDELFIPFAIFPRAKDQTFYVARVFKNYSNHRPGDRWCIVWKDWLRDWAGFVANHKKGENGEGELSLNGEKVQPKANDKNVFSGRKDSDVPFPLISPSSFESLVSDVEPESPENSRKSPGPLISDGIEKTLASLRKSYWADYCTVPLGVWELFAHWYGESSKVDLKVVMFEGKPVLETAPLTFKLWKFPRFSGYPKIDKSVSVKGSFTVKDFIQEIYKNSEVTSKSDSRPTLWVRKNYSKNKKEALSKSWRPLKYIDKPNEGLTNVSQIFNEVEESSLLRDLDIDTNIIVLNERSSKKMVEFGKKIRSGSELKVGGFVDVKDKNRWVLAEIKETKNNKCKVYALESINLDQTFHSMDYCKCLGAFCYCKYDLALPMTHSVVSSAHKNGSGNLGLINLGNTCYINAPLQCLASTHGILSFLRKENLDRNIKHDSPNFRFESLAFELEDLIRQKWEAKSPSVDTSNLKKNLDSKITCFRGSEQQDAHEFLIRFLDQIDTEAAPENGHSFIKNVFGGKIESKLTCAEGDCGYNSKVEEEFSTLSLSIPLNYSKKFEVCFCSSNRKINGFQVRLNSGSLVSDLLDNIEIGFAIPKSSMIVTICPELKFVRKILAPSEKILSNLKEKLCVFELDEPDLNVGVFEGMGEFATDSEKSKEDAENLSAPESQASGNDEQKSDNSLNINDDFDIKKFSNWGSKSCSLSSIPELDKKKSHPFEILKIFEKNPKKPLLVDKDELIYSFKLLKIGDLNSKEKRNKDEKMNYGQILNYADNNFFSTPLLFRYSTKSKSETIMEYVNRSVEALRQNVTSLKKAPGKRLFYDLYYVEKNNKIIHFANNPEKDKNAPWKSPDKLEFKTPEDVFNFTIIVSWRGKLRKFLKLKLPRDESTKKEKFEGSEFKPIWNFLQIFWKQKHSDSGSDNLGVPTVPRLKRPTNYDENKPPADYKFAVELPEGVQSPTHASVMEAELPPIHLGIFKNSSLLKSEPKLNIYDCIEYFTKEEAINDGWGCAECKKSGSANKQISFAQLPQTLVLHLKRFRAHIDGDNQSNAKVSEVVDFPVYGLQIDGVVYDLFAVVNHEGEGLQSGHYTAFSKNPGTGKWHRFDDESVREMDSSEIVTNEAYILFYEKSK